MRRSPLRSPPRMRGKDPPAAAMQGCPGITPACAGKSHSVTDANASSWDHPRVCGEKLSISSAHISQTGSPPRVRGKGETACEVVVKFGITPAYAGKSRILSNAPTRSGDHPRVCGEKAATPNVEAFYEGSPPRMRGKAVPLRSAAASGCRGPSVPEYDAPP